jgi:hypothetical protein
MQCTSIYKVCCAPAIYTGIWAHLLGKSCDVLRMTHHCGIKAGEGKDVKTTKPYYFLKILPNKSTKTKKSPF